MKMIKLTDKRHCECSYPSENSDVERCQRRSDILIRMMGEDKPVAACLEHAIEFVRGGDYELVLE